MIEDVGLTVDETQRTKTTEERLGDVRKEGSIRYVADALQRQGTLAK